MANFGICRELIDEEKSEATCTINLDQVAFFEKYMFSELNQEEIEIASKSVAAKN